MRFLADESCDFSVVRALRAAGHDVLAVTEFLSGEEDAVIMDLALRERRILLTEDKDYCAFRSLPPRRIPQVADLYGDAPEAGQGLGEIVRDQPERRFVFAVGGAVRGFSGQ